MKKLTLVIALVLFGIAACTKKAEQTDTTEPQSMGQEMKEEMAVPEEEMQNFEEMDSTDQKMEETSEEGM